MMRSSSRFGVLLTALLLAVLHSAQRSEFGFSDSVTGLVLHSAQRSEFGFSDSVTGLGFTPNLGFWV